MNNKLPLDGSICGSSTWFGTNNWVSVGDLTSFKRFKVPWVAIFFVSNSFNSRPGCLGLSSPRERPRVKAWGPWWAYKKFITCFHESWIYETWFFPPWNLTYSYYKWKISWGKKKSSFVDSGFVKTCYELVKVQLFWKGHKNLKKSPTCFDATE